MMRFKLWALVVVAFVLFSCSTDLGGETEGKQGRNSFMVFSLVGANGGAQVKSDPGVAGGEDKVNDVHILYFDSNNNYLGKSDKLTEADFEGVEMLYKTKNALSVPDETSKVFVVVNNFKSDGLTSRFTLPTDVNIGQQWSAINQAVFHASSDDVNAAITDFTGKQGASDNLMMANYGVRYSSGATLNVVDNGLVTVEIGKSADDAKSKSNIIAIDRLVAKAQFVIADNIVVKPATARFAFVGWELNATNRHIRLYSEHDADYNFAEVNGASVAYRKDANYLVSSYGTSNSWSEFKMQFAYLSNIGTDGTGATSTVARANKSVAYLPENTMAADAQLIGATTKIIVKGNYAPEGFELGESYFSYADKFYSLDNLKKAYMDDNLAFIEAVNDFMVASRLATIADDLPTKIAALTADDFNENTGVIAREKGAVRYFHKGISYYEQLIRHESRQQQDMAIARYGVVRNNWYTITMNSVTRAGTPWIPGGPTDPTTPPTTPDDYVIQLGVSVKVMQWVTWTHSVDL